MEIRVEMTQLSKLAESMQVTETALEEIRTVLTATTKDMDDWWVGSGRESYDELCRVRVKDIESFLVLIQKSKTSLQGAVQAYIAEEGELVDENETLSTDNIF